MLADRLGVLCLGSFVGFLLGFGLIKSTPSLRAALTVVGAALGGAPVAFLAGTDQKWLYPVGLLTGLVWVRVANARFSKAEAAREQSTRGALVAWLDVVAIVFATFAVLLYTVVSPPQPTLPQSGSLIITHSGDYEVFYPQRYVSAPSLSFPSGGSNIDDYRVVEQRADGFKISVGGWATTGSVLSWKAEGTPKR